MGEFNRRGPGLTDTGIAARAAIGAAKIDFGYTSSTAFGSALYLRGDEEPLTGQLYYDETASTWYYYNGSAWTGLLADAAGMTLQDAFNTSSGKITGSAVVDGGLEIEHGAATSNSGFLLLLDNNDTTDNPTCLIIDQVVAATGDAMVVNYNTAEVCSIDVNGIIDPGGLFLPDNTLAMFGAAIATYDGRISSDGTNLVISARSDDGAPLHLGTSTVAMDVKWWDTGSGYVQFDAGGAIVLFDAVDIVLGDSDVLKLGNGTANAGDFTITGTADPYLQIDAVAANGVVQVGANVATDWVFTTANGTATLDASGDLLTFNALDIIVNDSDILYFGDSKDISITWNATALAIDGLAANTQILVGATNNQDLVLYAQTATDFIFFNSDDTAKVLQFEDVTLQMMDDTEATFGDSKDVTIDWKSAGGLYIAAVTDDSVINVGDGTLSFDLKWFSANANTYIYFDASGNEWAFGADNYGVDVKLYGDTASSYALWDQSGDEMMFVGAHLWLKDDSQLEFGDNSDVVIDWAAAGGLYIIPVADNTMMYVGNGTTNFDLTWYGADATTTITFDVNGGSGSTGAWSFGADDHGVDVLFRGATASHVVWWDESIDTWIFGVDGDGVDVRFFGDTASTNMFWDTSEDQLVFTGATSIVGQRMNVITNATASITATVAQSGSLFICTQAGAVTFNLPAAQEGLYYYILRSTNATAITVTPNGAERIAPDGASYALLAAVGDSALVICTADATNEWIVIPGKLS